MGLGEADKFNSIGSYQTRSSPQDGFTTYPEVQSGYEPSSLFNGHAAEAVIGPALTVDPEGLKPSGRNVDGFEGADAEINFDPALAGAWVILLPCRSPFSPDIKLCRYELSGCV